MLSAMPVKVSMTVHLVVTSLLCAAMAATTAVAQDQQKAATRQAGDRETGKAAPKQRGDDDFSPMVKSKEKAAAPSEAGDDKATKLEEGVSPAAGETPKAGDSPPTSPAAAPPAGVAPKRAGVTRVCLVTTRAQVRDGDAARAAEAVRETFHSFLNGPTIETAALGARLPALAAEEARQSGCGYVLHTSLTQKKGGGGLFGKVIGNVGSSVYIPGGSSVGGAVARSAATGAVSAAAQLAASIKAKDELVLEYRLETTDGAGPVVAKTEKAKAKADGEDVLTPLVERAAAAVAAAATNR